LGSSYLKDMTEYKMLKFGRAAALFWSWSVATHRLAAINKMLEPYRKKFNELTKAFNEFVNEIELDTKMKRLILSLEKFDFDFTTE